MATTCFSSKLLQSQLWIWNMLILLTMKSWPCVNLTLLSYQRSSLFGKLYDKQLRNCENYQVINMCFIMVVFCCCRFIIHPHIKMSHHYILSYWKHHMCSDHLMTTLCLNPPPQVSNKATVTLIIDLTLVLTKKQPELRCCENKSRHNAAI